MTSMSASQRVASLRDGYARLGKNVDHLSDIDLLNQEVERWANESRRHENAHNSLLQDQVKHDRDVYAAARRAATEDRTAWAGMYLGHLVTQSAHHINAVINRAAELPDGRTPAEQTRELKEAAERAKWSMSGLVGSRQVQFEDARRQNPAISLVEKQQEEIWRLRNFITALGQKLHAKHSESGARVKNGRCGCSGCKLIRAMDDVSAEQSTPTAV